jgi:hypothetical protein
VFIYQTPNWYEVQMTWNANQLFIWDPTNRVYWPVTVPLAGHHDDTSFELRVGLVDIGDPLGFMRMGAGLGAHCAQVGQYRCDVFPDGIVSGYSLNQGNMHTVLLP